jgi:hypothetical protein
MKKRVMGWMAVLAAVVVVGLSGCASLERAYDSEVTWSEVPMVKVVTNAVVVTNT